MAAPVAPLDEDWEDFNEFKAADSHSSWTAAPENSPQTQSFASFDETLSASFPYSGSACTSVSVSERELLRDDEQNWSLRGLCMSELLERLEEVERQIRGFSEELIDQLAVREELDYEKEVKNTFISALIHVQNRQKEHRELLKKKRKIKTTGAEQRSNRSHVPGTYLTTVIPYDKSSGAPSVEDLQILTKILHAMREDSDTVPALLTDYILKVLCPT
ncbi:fasciculation and elongation protein zeta-2-like [Sinocyclocheilus grahami]|uniref:fasciculation and elongation protein zeta-2-like n=1 Tax=Sinocyclocheilus grahami TaxID=75366 RepID=UPI0007AD59FE|nr:PREDICTED: fasciculation and elongation protein zeta-2-like [Sinocyclocheilus grahami]